MTITQFHQSLHQWYQKNGRKDLPWRHTEDPYHILVSEMMLQQTQVKTVLERFYHPFLRRFPTLQSLADASLEEVMQQWQGLGYYRRAKFLHQVAQRSAPYLPKTYDELIELPGIGKNTAHALLALAYKQPYPVMEANVKRIICRVFALQDPKEKQLWDYAYKLLDVAEPFDYNQAMMDIGALVCTPKAPKCDVCPTSHICEGKAQPELYPAPKEKKQTPIRKQRILVIEDTDGFTYLTPRSGEFLHGLYQFVELDEMEDVIELNGQLYPERSWQYMGAVEQTYSHFKQYAQIYRLVYHDAHESDGWHGENRLHALPISKKEEKILKLLQKVPSPRGGGLGWGPVKT